MDKRSQQLLKVLINQHAKDASPIGSKTLSTHSNVDLSPASIRNIMKNLEEQGFIKSPHTSSGRIPTKKGYRYFVDSLMTHKRPSANEVHLITSELNNQSENSNIIADTLSSLTHHAGLIIVPRIKKNVFKHIEFINLSTNKVLAILVTNDGHVMNKILNVDKSYESYELTEFSNYFTKNYSGLTIKEGPVPFFPGSPDALRSLRVFASFFLLLNIALYASPTNGLSIFVLTLVISFSYLSAAVFGSRAA